MKSKTLLLTGVLMFALLSACTAVGSSPTNPTAETGTTATSSTGNNLPTSALLITGSLKLEGTDQAITQAQAGDLLFLWQGYRELSTRDSAAPEEKATILNQVEKSMTTEQMTAISALNLSIQDAVALARVQGSTFGGSSSASSASSNSIRSGASGSGGGPGGMIITFDGGGPGGMPPDGIGTRSSGTTSTDTTQKISRISDTMAVTLLDPLIKLLERRIAGK